MGLEGTLASFSVTDIFQVLSLQRKTGTLTVVGKNDTIKVSFLTGEIVSADSASRDLEASVGNLLVLSGRLTREDLERVRRARKETSFAVWGSPAQAHAAAIEAEFEALNAVLQQRRR